MSTNFHNADDPYRNLWAAVMLNALENLSSKKHSDSALHFFRSHHGMFVWICDALGLPKETIRKRAEQKRKLTEKRWKRRKNASSDLVRRVGNPTEGADRVYTEAPDTDWGEADDLPYNETLFGVRF